MRVIMSDFKVPVVIKNERKVSVLGPLSNLKDSSVFCHYKVLSSHVAPKVGTPMSHAEFKKKKTCVNHFSSDDIVFFVHVELKKKHRPCVEF